MSEFRHITEDETTEFYFSTTQFSTGAPITLAGTPSVHARVNGSATEITTGITLSVDFDSKTGHHKVTWDSSSSASYAADAQVDFFISAGTADSVSVVGLQIGPTYKIVAAGDTAALITRALLALPTAAPDAAGGLPISDAGGLDLDAQRSDIAAILTDTGTTLQAELDGIQADTEDIQSRLPAALLDGLMMSDVHSIRGSDAAGQNFAKFFDGTGYAGTNNVIPTVTTLTNLPAITAGWLTATGIAPDAITADKLAADAVSEIQSGLSTLTAAGVRAAVGLAAANLDTQLSSIMSYASALTASMKAISLDEDSVGTTGQDTTHVHLPNLTYGDDEINDFLLVIFDDSAGEYHSRWIDDWVNSSKLATVATLPFTPENLMDTYWLTSIRRDVVGGGDATEANQLTILSDLDDIKGYGFDTNTDSLVEIVDLVNAVGSLLTTASGNINDIETFLTAADIDGKTLKAAIAIVAAVVAGRISGAQTGTEVFKGLDEATDRVTVVVDSQGNRSDVVYH